MATPESANIHAHMKDGLDKINELDLLVHEASSSASGLALSMLQSRVPASGDEGEEIYRLMMQSTINKMQESLTISLQTTVNKRVLLGEGKGLR